MNTAEQPRYFLDEGLPHYIASGIQRFGFECRPVPRSTSDQEIIKDIGVRYGNLGVRIARDLQSRTKHRKDIIDAGISVAWIIDENGTPAKQCFLVYNFVYRYGDMIANSSAPLYFDVRERLTKNIPSAVVKKVTL